MRHARPSVTKETLRKYESFANTLQQSRGFGADFRFPGAPAGGGPAAGGAPAAAAPGAGAAVAEDDDLDLVCGEKGAL